MTERKNICITINSLASGGAEKQALLLAKSLKLYHNTVLVILKPEPVYKPYLELVEEENLDHLYLSNNVVRKVFGFKKVLKNRKIDIVFSFLPTDTIISGISGKMAGVPFIIGGIRNSYVPKKKFMVLRAIHNSLLSYTIANNFAAYKAAIDFGFKDTVFVVPNGIAIRPSIKKTEQKNSVINIISLGRLVPQKDYKTALKAIVELKKRIPAKVTLKYRIVGDGPEKENILTAIKKSGLEEEIEIISNPPAVYPLLESSDIYLCTSVFEGISNAIMEAMNCGLPIVATNAGDNSKLIQHKKNGFITNLKDYEKLSEHIQALIQSKGMRNKMGKESYNHLVNSFSDTVFQKKYLHIVDNIADLKTYEGEFVEK